MSLNHAHSAEGWQGLGVRLGGFLYTAGGAMQGLDFTVQKKKQSKHGTGEWKGARMTHELKILPEYYEAVVKREKTFEIRKNDRGFHVGDTLVLKEWDGENYTGRSVSRYVNYILYDWQDGLKDGYCIMNLSRARKLIEDAPSAQPEIIRCRDCIAYQEGIDIDGKPFTRCNGSVRTYGHTLPDWYCADAERRTDERSD